MKAASLYVSSGVSEDMRREGVAAERRTEEHAAADCSRPALLGIFTMEWPPVLKAEVPAARQTRRNALDIILACLALLFLALPSSFLLPAPGDAGFGTENKGCEPCTCPEDREEGNLVCGW
jgi:hypothetical protein